MVELTDWERILGIRKAYRAGDTIPTYHNICGRRTTYDTCHCNVCKPHKGATHG